jgi:hypothetical protein
MRKALTLLGALAVGLTASGCMSDDSESTRRPAAMEVREASALGSVQLSLGQSETSWRSYSWGTNVDVLEQKSTSPEGQAIVTLVAGPVRAGTMVLERGLVQDSQAIAALFSNGPTNFQAATVTLHAADGSQIGTYALSGGVVADLKHRSEGTSLLETLTLRFGSASFQM